MQFLAVVFATLAAGAYASPHGLEDRQASATTVPPHFVCRQDSDCVERNVGNCCGYYPMCANAKATLPHPCPGGGASVCGWPSIDSCKCGSLGGCMSLQGDRIVHGSQWQ